MGLLAVPFAYGIVFIIYKLRGHRFKLMRKSRLIHVSCLAYLLIIFLPSFVYVDFFPILIGFSTSLSFFLSYCLSFFWRPGTRAWLNPNPLYHPLLISQCKSFSSFFPSFMPSCIHLVFLLKLLFFGFWMTDAANWIHDNLQSMGPPRPGLTVVLPDVCQL